MALDLGCKTAAQIECPPGNFPDKCPDDNNLYACVPCPPRSYSSAYSKHGDLCDLRRECSDQMIESKETIGSKTEDAVCECKEEHFEINKDLFECLPKESQTTTVELEASTTAPDKWSTVSISLYSCSVAAIVVLLIIIGVLVYKKKSKKKRYAPVRSEENGGQIQDKIEFVLSEADNSKESNDEAISIAKIFLPGQIGNDMLPRLARELIPDQKNAFEQIKVKVDGDLKEQIIQLLINWENKYGHKATLRLLCNALCEIDAKKIAQELCLKVCSDMQEKQGPRTLGHSQSNGAAVQMHNEELSSQSNGAIPQPENTGPTSNGVSTSPV